MKLNQNNKKIYTVLVVVLLMSVSCQQDKSTQELISAKNKIDSLGQELKKINIVLEKQKEIATFHFKEYQKLKSECD